jgi:hypothetical protein
VSGRASTAGRGYGPSTAWHSCRVGPGTIKQVVSRAGSPDTYDPFGHLYLRTIMMILALVATTSFTILLLFSLPSCLHLRATPFSAEGVGECASSSYSSTPAPTPTHAMAIARPRGCFTSCAQQHFRHRRTSRSSSRPSPYFSCPTCCPRPRLQPRADRCSSTRVQRESVMLLAFLRVCRRGGHGGTCHAWVILMMRSLGLRYWTTKASVAAVVICYGVGGGVVSLRRVYGWEDTHILSPFSD